jgi:hypothetical protein
VISQLKREVPWQVVENVSDQISLSLHKKLDDEKESALRFAL